MKQLLITQTMIDHGPDSGFVYSNSIKGAVSSDSLILALLAKFPFLKGFEETFVKRPQCKKVYKWSVVSDQKIKNVKIPP